MTVAQLDSEFHTATQQLDGGSPVPCACDRDGLATTTGLLAIIRSPSHGLITGTTLGSETTTEAYNGHGELDSSAALFGGNTLRGTASGASASVS